MSDAGLIRGLGADRRLGQNFLIDNNYIERELSFCSPSGKTVLEIGPGLGALSIGLAKEAKHLTVVEIDERFVPILKERLREFKNIEIICGDALALEGGKFDLIVSNLPYCIASKLILKFPAFDFKEAVICIQKELAGRMDASPGSRDYSRFSVMCQLLFEVESLCSVPAGAFCPKPKVDSALVRLRKRGTVPGPLSLFINAVFQHRNKKLRNAINDSRELLGLENMTAKRVAGGVGLGERRVITLSKEEVLSSFEEYKRLLVLPSIP